MSEKREKFVRLAEARVSKTIKDIKLIGNLSNKSSYEYTDADIKKIVSALDSEVRQLRGRFEESRPSDTSAFKL